MAGTLWVSFSKLKKSVLFAKERKILYLCVVKFKHVTGSNTYILTFFPCTAPDLLWYFGHAFHAFFTHRWSEFPKDTSSFVSTGCLNCLDHVFSSVFLSSLADTVWVQQQLREKVEPHHLHHLFTLQERAERGEGTVGQNFTRATLSLSWMCRAKVCFFHLEYPEAGEEAKAGKCHSYWWRLCVLLLRDPVHGSQNDDKTLPHEKKAQCNSNTWYCLERNAEVKWDLNLWWY